MLEFGNVLPSVLNWTVVGLMALTFIIAAKFILTKFNVPAVSDLVAGV